MLWLGLSGNSQWGQVRGVKASQDMAKGIHQTPILKGQLIFRRTASWGVRSSSWEHTTWGSSRDEYAWAQGFHPGSQTEGECCLSESHEPLPLHYINIFRGYAHSAVKRSIHSPCVPFHVEISSIYSIWFLKCFPSLGSTNYQQPLSTCILLAFAYSLVLLSEKDINQHLKLKPYHNRDGS